MMHMHCVWDIQRIGTVLCTNCILKQLITPPYQAYFYSLHLENLLETGKLRLSLARTCNARQHCCHVRCLSLPTRIQFASVAPCTGQRGVAKRATGSLDGLFSSPGITALLPRSLASSNRKIFCRAIAQILNYRKKLNYFS